MSAEISAYKSIGSAENRLYLKYSKQVVFLDFLDLCSGFLGGEKIQQLETAWCEKFDSEFAISVNSNTWTSDCPWCNWVVAR